MAWNEMRSKIVRCIHACADDIDARRIETFPRHLKELKKCKDILQGMEPYIFGKSTANVPIERWWKDWNRGVLQYKEVFMYCESLDIDLDNELTRYIFHAVFIRRIQHSANCFMEIWNNHPMRLKHNKTPNEVWNNHPMQLQPAHPAAKVNWGSIIPQNLTANIVRSKYAIDDEMKMFIDEELKKLNMQLLNSRVFGLDVWYELMNLANQKICGMNQGIVIRASLKRHLLHSLWTQ
eukprot:367198_1